MALRVLTYNVHAGVGMDAKLNLERIAAVIRALDPDLVALQEVDRNTRRSGREDQCARYAELTGLHGVFGRAISLQGGEYGQAILSRWPILDSHVHSLPTGPASESRIALAVRVQPSPTAPELTFITTHFTFAPDDERPAQAARINELFPFSKNLPTILAGDFNAKPGSEPLSILNRNWRDVTNDSHTFPAHQPVLKIDYIFVSRDSAFTMRETKVITESVASDHLPVLSIIDHPLFPSTPGGRFF